MHQGQYILYLNPDTELRTNALSGMLKFSENESRHMVQLAANFSIRTASIQYTCARAFPTPFNQFCELAGLNRLFPKTPLFSALEMHYWDHRESREVECLSGACMMMKKEIADSLGGFDENLLYVCRGCRSCAIGSGRQGWKIHYLAEEEIVHHEGASSKKKSNKAFQHHQDPGSPMSHFLEKTFRHH